MPPAPSLQEIIQLVEVEAGGDSPLDRLETASAMVGELIGVGDAALGYFVDQARHAGCTWSEIGQALGVTKQAAQQRHTFRPGLGPNAHTFERFTPRARQALSVAEPIAREWGHPFIGTEHLLLALYRDPGSLAFQVLVGAGLSEEDAVKAVGRRIEPGNGAPDGELAFTPNAKAVLSAALAASLSRGHNYLGTEHLLLGLSRGAGIAPDVLAEAGLAAERLDELVDEELSRYTHQSGTTTATAGPGAAAMPDRTKRGGGADAPTA